MLESSARPDSEETVLLTRMRALYVQLDDAQSDTPEYERLSAAIHELAIAYGILVAAKYDSTRDRTPSSNPRSRSNRRFDN